VFVRKNVISWTCCIRIESHDGSARKLPRAIWSCHDFGRRNKRVVLLSPISYSGHRTQSV